MDGKKERIKLIDFNLHSNGIKINGVTRIFMIEFFQAALIIFNFLFLACLFQGLKGEKIRWNIRARRAGGLIILSARRDLKARFNYTNKFAFSHPHPPLRLRITVNYSLWNAFVTGEILGTDWWKLGCAGVFKLWNFRCECFLKSLN